MLVLSLAAGAGPQTDRQTGQDRTVSTILFLAAHSVKHVLLYTINASIGER